MNKIIKIIFIFIISLIFASKGIAEIKDSLLATVGNKPITKSDIVNEIKIILILNNDSYSDDKRDKLYRLAMKSTVKRNIKQIEIDKYDLDYNKKDLQNELIRLANAINIDLDTLKNICASNELNFSLIEDQVKAELLWNSLIFQLYKDRISINVEEINEQLNTLKNKKELDEYLISEIVIKPINRQNYESEIEELRKKIEIEGFEKVAMNLSISVSAIKGGDLGWLNENIISEKFKSKIFITPVGKISEPILLPEGVVIFKIREKRKVQNKLTTEEEKNLLVNMEKSKILNMFSKSHYDNVRRSLAINIFNE